MLTLIFGKKGGPGVNKKLANGFSDPENPYNGGFNNNNII